MTTQTSPRASQSTAKVAKLHRHEGGVIHALSSDGVTIYLIRQTADGFTCTCPGFTHYGRCYHAATAAVRYGTPNPDPEPPSPAAPAMPANLLAVLATCERQRCQGGCTRDHARPLPGVICSTCRRFVPTGIATWETDDGRHVCFACEDAAFTAASARAQVAA